VNADPFGGYLRPAHGGRILLGVETPARPEFRVSDLGFRLDELSDQEGLRDRAIERFRDFFPPLATVRWESAHVGLLSFSLDGEPILGPVPGCSGLFVGLCFHSGGFSYSPASGRFLAEYVANGAPSIDLTAFLPGRTPADETQAYLAATISQDQSFRRRH
jgi:4-methylaminobutanoate oxidase (formaldehyde-forming)